MVSPDVILWEKRLTQMPLAHCVSHAYQCFAMLIEAPTDVESVTVRMHRRMQVSRPVML